MRNIIAVVFLLISVLVCSQSTNVFADGEQNSSDPASTRVYETSDNLVATEAAEDDGPPPPTDPVPIDDYLPVLLITAVGIIVHAGWRKRKQTA